MATTCVFTNVGKGIVPSVLAGTSGYVVPRYVGWGTGSGTPAATDTALFAESTQETRVQGTLGTATTTNPNDTFVVQATMTCSPSGTAETITEAGVFDAATGGRLFLHMGFTGIPLNPGDSIALTFQLQFQ